MKETLQFLQKAGTFYLATVDGDQPRVRPFGGAVEVEGKFYFATTNVKPVFRQLKANPKVELCAMADGKWIRVEGEAVHDPRREARAAMLDSTPRGRSTYNEDDGLFEVFYLQNATATICSYGEEPEVYHF